MSRWPKSFFVGKLCVGLFNYWIGFSSRKMGKGHIWDCGYVKFWWMPQ